MGTEIQTWQVVDGELVAISTTLAQQGKTEPYDLEAWIASDAAIVGPELRIIGRQVSTDSGPLDLLGIDRSGNLVVVELKREKLPREALTQAIDYASDVSEWSLEKISEICLKFTGKSLEDFIIEEFPEENLESLNINETQRIILIGFAIEGSLERMIHWLSDTYGMSINAVLLHYARTSHGDELISRSAVISEAIAEKHAKAKKFTIPMSDEPGTYEMDELRSLLSKYLGQSMVTAQRMRDVLLPLCLEHPKVKREQLKDEFVRAGIAEDQFKAGIYLTLISSQLGMAKNDFLRQVIGYEYPNYEWEKDNYFIREGMKPLVKALLG